MSLKRSAIASAMSAALVLSAVPATADEIIVADTSYRQATGSQTGTAVAENTLKVIYSGVSLFVGALSAGGFWGIIYNALVSRGIIPGQIEPNLPVL
ncbi:hypothetical protein ACU6QD_11460 [Corynebacterium glucuronolyticum]